MMMMMVEEKKENGLSSIYLSIKWPIRIAGQRAADALTPPRSNQMTGTSGQMAHEGQLIKNYLRFRNLP